MDHWDASLSGSLPIGSSLLSPLLDLALSGRLRHHAVNLRAENRTCDTRQSVSQWRTCRTSIQATHRVHYVLKLLPDSLVPIDRSNEIQRVRERVRDVNRHRWGWRTGTHTIRCLLTEFCPSNAFETTTATRERVYARERVSLYTRARFDDHARSKSTATIRTYLHVATVARDVRHRDALRIQGRLDLGTHALNQLALDLALARGRDDQRPPRVGRQHRERRRPGLHARPRRQCGQVSQHRRSRGCGSRERA